MKIALSKQERALVFSGKQRSVSRPVIASNSTVLGRKANPRHDARHYFDGWKHLGVNDKRTYPDGQPKKNVAYGLFGAGKNKGFSCGEYLHAPVLGDDEGRRYRVRSVIQPGDTLRFGRVVNTICTAVRVRKIKEKWHWVYEFNPVRIKVAA